MAQKRQKPTSPSLGIFVQLMVTLFKEKLPDFEVVSLKWLLANKHERTILAIKKGAVGNLPTDSMLLEETHSLE
jgi:hypothetical protein